MYNAQDIWGSLVYFPKFDEGFHSNFPIFSVTKGSYKPLITSLSIKINHKVFLAMYVPQNEWQWIYCIVSQTALMAAKTCHVQLTAGSAFQRIMSWSSRTVREQQTRKMCAYWKDFFSTQLKVISFSTVPQSSSLCGIPINFKRQIFDWIISTENREKRLVGLGKLPRILSEEMSWDDLE